MIRYTKSMPTFKCEVNNKTMHKQVLTQMVRNKNGKYIAFTTPTIYQKKLGEIGKYKATDFDGVIGSADLTGHRNEKAIIDILNEWYDKKQYMPTNGDGGDTLTARVRNTSPYVTSDNADLVARARSGCSWDATTLAHIFFIKRTMRWRYGFCPNTKAAVKFREKVAQAVKRMKVDDIYAKHMRKKYEEA